MSSGNVGSQNRQDYQLIKNNFFIKKLSNKYILTSVISMLFLFAGSFIDTLVVGAFLSESGLSAMSLVSPVYLIYYTIGATIGIGACIAASRSLGNERLDEYRKIFTCSTFLMMFFVVLMTVVGYVFLNPICALLSGGYDSPEYPLVRDYLMFYIPGGGFNLMAYIPLYFLKTEGCPKISSRLFTASALINVVLSWLFMNPNVLNMSLGGASLATSIAMLITASLGYIILLTNKHGNLQFLHPSVRWQYIKEIVISGIPNGLSNLLSSARILLINTLLMAIGASVFLPCYTVVRNISDLLGSVALGIIYALVPIIGVFYGERDYNTERSVIRTWMKIGLAIMPVLIIAACVATVPLFRLFGVTDESLIAEGKWALPLACAGIVISYVNTFYTSYLTAIKREKLATLLISIRLLLGLAIFAIPLAFTIGTYGIWASLSLAEAVALVAFEITRAIIMKKNKKIDKYFLNTSHENNTDIVFSVKNDIVDIVKASENVSEYCESVDLDMKRSMRAGNAVEEVLTVLIKYCLGDDRDNYVDVRVCKLGEEVMMRFRYIGEIFDPIKFYRDNIDNEEMEEVLLGIKMIEKTASLIEFKQTLGTNTLMIIF